MTLMSKAMINEVTPLPTQYPNEDTWWSLCIRFFAEEQIRINDIVAYYRIHDGNGISRDTDFSEFNIKYHARLIANEEFLMQYKHRLSERDQNVLRSEIELENYRYNGDTFKIIFKAKCELVKKMRAAFLSNIIFYKTKKRYDRFMLGH